MKVWVVAISILFSSTAFAVPIIQAGAVSVGDRAYFGLEFQDVPDFFTVDEFGRQKDEFQFYVDANNPVPTSTARFSEATVGIVSDEGLTIIRGGEVYKRGTIIVRDVAPFWTPPAGELSTGGWGPIVEELGFLQLSKVLVFSAPLASIKSDGDFYWNLQTLRFGATDGPILLGRSLNLTTEVAEPSALSLFGAGLFVLGLVRTRRPA